MPDKYERVNQLIALANDLLTMAADTLNEATDEAFADITARLDGFTPEDVPCNGLWAPCGSTDCATYGPRDCGGHHA